MSKRKYILGGEGNDDKNVVEKSRSSVTGFWWEKWFEKPFVEAAGRNILFDNLWRCQHVSECVGGWVWKLIGSFNLHRSRRAVSAVCLRPRGFWQKLLGFDKLSLSGFKSKGTDGIPVKTSSIETFSRFIFRGGGNLVEGLFKPLSLLNLHIWKDIGNL